LAEPREQIRCTLCGFIRNDLKMPICPSCGDRDTDNRAPSYSPKREALQLFCEALHITPVCADAGKIKQALDVIGIGGW